MSTLRQLLRSCSSWGCLLAVLLAGAALVCDRNSWGHAINQLAYDPLLRTVSQFMIAPAQVLLVYTPPRQDLAPAEAMRLASKIERLGAMGIGFLDAGIGWTDAEIAYVARSGRVTVGSTRTRARNRSDSLPLGSVELVHTADGVYRQHYGLATVSTPKIGSLVSQMADRVCQQGSVPRGIFGIRFRAGLDGLPHVTSQAVEDDEIIESLVHGKMVLIGRAPDPLLPGVATPTSGNQRMSVLEFHGQALNSLLMGTTITILPPVSRGVIYLTMIGCCSAIARRTTLRTSWARLTTVFGIQSFATWFLLSWWNLWLPLVSLVAVEAFATVYVLSGRMRYSEQAWKAMRRAGFQLSPRYRQHPVVDADVPPWPRIGSFLQHLFPLDRLAILVLTTNRERLELVSTLGCSDNGVVERRRDVRRSPFFDAIERRTALRVDENRPFFQPAPDHYQYLVPLLFAGKVEGAIVVELSREAAENCVELTDQLMSIGEEIAPWIARYQRISQHAAAKRSWWRRWHVTREQELFEHLQGHLHMMERRSHQTYQVVEQSSSGKAVFDLSGSIITMNATMFRLLHPYGVASLDVTLLQLISALCQRDLSACRALLRRVVVEGREERCVLQNPSTRAHLVLMLRPLKAPQNVKHREDEILAFETLGVHVELFESDMFSDVHQLREHIAEQALEVVDEILDEVHLLTQACRAGSMDDPWNQLDTSVELAQSTVQRCQSMLDAGYSDDPHNCLPVAVAPLVQRSVAEAEAFLERSGISIHTSLPSDLPDVIANPHRLHIALLWVLEELAHHAHGNSAIHVDVGIETDHLILTCHHKDSEYGIGPLGTSGIAIPTDLPGQANRLGEAGQWLRVWGGELTIDAMPGAGSLVRLSLQPFDWNNRGAVRLVSSNCNVTSS